MNAPADASHDRRPSEPSASGRRILAPAKLNLNLLVGPRREDGFHPLDSIVVQIDFCDELHLQPRRDGEIHLRCEGFDCGEPGKNLALRAAHALRPLAPGDARGLDITLLKRIPPGAGLGGGSSDAAAVLTAASALWGLTLPPDDLNTLAATLGSDVPLFLGPTAVRMTSRGEVWTPIDVHPFTAVLLLPPLACPTRDVYAAFDAEPEGMGEQVEAEVVASQAPSRWRGRLVNQLEGPARRVNAELDATWRALQAALPVPLHLTGSGAAMFALCDDAREALTVRAAATAAAVRAVVVHPFVR